MNRIRASRRLGYLPERAQVAALFLAALLTHALWPKVAWAGCGVTDFSACADDAQYTVWYGVASFLWAIDAMLLQLAYLVDVFRVWAVETAFTSAYGVLVTLINPLLVPFATIALIVAVLLFLLTPMFGPIRFMNVRHVLVWALIAPLLLTVSGPLIVQVEQARTQLGAAIFTDVSAIAPGAIFGVAATDMAAPTPLYGGNPCGTGALARPGTGVNSASLHMDDLAAAMLWANAQDIHCPKFSGAGQDIPDAFYLDTPDGPGFATTNKVGDMNDSSARATAIQNIQRGATRLALGILPSILAVLEMLVNLVFGLALVALWLGLPLGLAFIFFEESSASIAMLFRQGFGVLKVSWASSFLMAILFAALKSSAEMGNAAAYTGLAGGSIILMAWLLITAFGTLSGSVKALSSSVMAGTGLNVMQPVELAAGAAGLAAGALTGGAALAATAAAAYQQTGSGRYAAGAAAGRIGKLAQLGEVAAAMGYLQDEEVVAGLHAGDRSTQSYRSMRLQMVTDAKRKGDNGLTMRERTQERDLTRQVDNATGAGAWRSINAGAAAAGGAVAGAYDYVRSGQGLQDARGSGSRLLESIGDSWHRARQGVAQFGAEVDARANAAGPSAFGEVGVLTRGAAAAIAVTHDRLNPDGRYQAYRLDETGQMQMMQRQDADGTLPSDALTVPNAAANLPRLLRQGYAVQQNPDKTVTVWQTDPKKAAAAAAAPEKQIEQLYKDGALNKAEVKAAAAAEIASGTPSAGPPPQKYLEVPPAEAGTYRVREIADGQVVARHKVDSADAVADLAAEKGLPVRTVASAPEVTVGGWRVIDMGSDQVAAPLSAAQAPAPAPTAPGTQSRVERLAASRGAQVRPDAPTVPAGAGDVAPPHAAGSQSIPVSSQATHEAPTPGLSRDEGAQAGAGAAAPSSQSAASQPVQTVSQILPDAPTMSAAPVVPQPTASQPIPVVSPTPMTLPTAPPEAAPVAPSPPAASHPIPVVTQAPAAAPLPAANQSAVVREAPIAPPPPMSQPVQTASQVPPEAPTVPAGAAPAAPPAPAPAGSRPVPVVSQTPIEITTIAASAAPAAPPASRPAPVVSQVTPKAPTTPASAAPAAPAQAVSRPVPVVSQVPIEIQTAPIGAGSAASPAPIASQQVPVVSQITPDAPPAPVSAAPVAPAPPQPAASQPAPAVNQGTAQEPDTPASVPDVGTADVAQTDSEE
jgi:hypothetical protein